MHRLVLEVKVDAPLGRQREHMQVGVGAAVGVGLHLADRLGDPGPADRVTVVDVLGHALTLRRFPWPKRAGWSRRNALGDIFERRIVDTGHLPLFCFFVAFIVTFVFTRVNVRLIRANVRWWFRNVKAGDLHIHHVVFGVVLMLIGGGGSFAVPDLYGPLNAATAVGFGGGSALVLDEVALVLHLRAVCSAGGGGGP